MLLDAFWKVTVVMLVLLQKSKIQVTINKYPSGQSPCKNTIFIVTPLTLSADHANTMLTAPAPSAVALSLVGVGARPRRRLHQPPSALAPALIAPVGFAVRRPPESTLEPFPVGVHRPGPR